MKVEIEKHLQRADELLEVASSLLEMGYPSDCVSRSYYAVFHAASAVLLNLNIERKSHHAVWAAFGQFVTARGLMKVKYHHFGLQLFIARSQSDYLPQPEDTPEDARKNLDRDREFVAACRALLAKNVC